MKSLVYESEYPLVLYPPEFALKLKLFLFLKGTNIKGLFSCELNIED